LHHPGLIADRDHDVALGKLCHIQSKYRLPPSNWRQNYSDNGTFAGPKLLTANASPRSDRLT
jgi:hypothetical protein